MAEKIGKRQADGSVNRRHRGLHSVARKIDPFQKVSDFVSADAQGDLQALPDPSLFDSGRVETRTALLDVSEVKGGRIRDRLNVSLPNWRIA